MVTVVTKKAPIKARGEKFGNSKQTTSNTEWRFISRNPKGWSYFFLQLRYQSHMYIQYILLILPCWTKKSLPAVSI
jgi:hypothetical protein